MINKKEVRHMLGLGIAMAMCNMDTTKTIVPQPKLEPLNRIPVIPKGHKEFTIQGVKIYALNHKNAIKKFNKLYKSKTYGQR